MSKASKIATIIIIIAVISGIWLFKNGDTSTTELLNDDFALHQVQRIEMDRLKTHNLPIIIDFGSDSCIPCKEMAPVLAKLNSELQGRAIIKFVDVWKFKDVADGYPVTMIPTQIFIDSNGKPYSPDGTEQFPLTVYKSESTGEHIFTYHVGQVTEEELLDVLKKMGMK
jgi:thioredoxin 1